MISDFFYEPLNNVTYELKIKRSLFIAHVSVSRSEEIARQFISDVSQKHKQATHNCWAYRVGIDPIIEYCSDAGEPSGTAGKPILGAIQRANLTFTTVVITRYFGGIKLGVRGLIEAYGNATTQALEKAGKKEGRMGKRGYVEFPYSLYKTIVYQLKNRDVSEESMLPAYAETITLSFFVPLSSVPSVESYLSEEEASGMIKKWGWEETSKDQ
ncbi:MAG TPA: thymidylate synthase [Aminobacterium sp.]|jgi:uncharacterized YigZ family protein|uniref:IMPACT family protein n=1 Tax=Aminobacterium TaxID=81466 RepID=UPI000467C8E2|nr:MULTISPECIES: YigZ family protein [Aminobacterium]HCA40348.1 thymidylate synthase [Aminobacterium sp.]